MIERKTTVLTVFVVALAVMAIVYAAFSTNLKVNVTASGAGINVTYTCTCTGSAGLTGATAPSGTCTVASNNQTITIAATLYQPADNVACAITATNNSGFAVKVSTAFTCNSLSSPFSSSISSAPATSDAAVAVGGTKKWTVNIGYASSVTSDPSSSNKTSPTLTCDMAWSQAA